MYCYHCIHCMDEHILPHARKHRIISILLSHKISLSHSLRYAAFFKLNGDFDGFEYSKLLLFPIMDVSIIILFAYFSAADFFSNRHPSSRKSTIFSFIAVILFWIDEWVADIVRMNCLIGITTNITSFPFETGISHPPFRPNNHI